MNTDQILENSADITLEAGSSSKFCEIWPSARKGLELLKDILKNPIAKVTVGIVISAGDAVSETICG